MATGDAKFNAHGNARDVDLLYTVRADEIIYIAPQVGIAGESADSADTISLDCADDVRVVELPAAFSGVVGDTLFLDTAQVTGHSFDDAAYGKSAGAGIIKFGILLTDQDANNLARVLRVGKGVFLS